MHMGEPLIKFDYVIVSLSARAPSICRISFASSPLFSFLNSFPLSLKKKKKKPTHSWEARCGARFCGRRCGRAGGQRQGRGGGRASEGSPQWPRAHASRALGGGLPGVQWGRGGPSLSSWREGAGCFLCRGAPPREAVGRCHPLRHRTRRA